jgi:hypothetical protein
VIPVVYYLNHKQKNYGKNNQEEHEDRMGIPIDYAPIYKKDENGRYKLIQKPTKTMKSELKKKWWELIINLF